MSHDHKEHRSAWQSLPSPWDVVAERRPTRAAILRALYEQRAELLTQYPHLVLPAKPHPTPVVVLLDLWREWDLAHAPCGACGGIGLVTGFGGALSRGSLGGVCIGCQRVLRRAIGGMGVILRATASIRACHRYPFFGSFPGNWGLHGPALGVVAVLQELGVSGLRARARGQL